MKHPDKKHPEEKKKGTEDRSIRQDRKPHEKYNYPEPSLSDKQYDDQPEFIEPKSDKKTDNQEEN